MAETKSSSRPAQSGTAPASQITNIFGPIRLLPGESADVYKTGLIATIKELGATTHLQTYLAEKIFQCLWWMRRYEIQKQASVLNAMVRLATRHSVPEITKLNLTKNLQAHQWDDPKVKEFLKEKGFTPEGLSAQGMSEAREEIQKLDMLIALRVKTLGQRLSAFGPSLSKTSDQPVGQGHPNGCQGRRVLIFTKRSQFFEQAQPPNLLRVVRQQGRGVGRLS